MNLAVVIIIIIPKCRRRSWIYVRWWRSLLIYVAGINTTNNNSVGKRNYLTFNMCVHPSVAATTVAVFGSNQTRFMDLIRFPHSMVLTSPLDTRRPKSVVQKIVRKRGATAKLTTATVMFEVKRWLMIFHCHETKVSSKSQAYPLVYNNTTKINDRPMSLLLHFVEIFINGKKVCSNKLSFNIYLFIYFLPSSVRGGEAECSHLLFWFNVCCRE